MTSLNEIASANILTFLDEGRLIQRSWHAERKGKEMACLLGAAGGYKSIEDCPAELMPRWLAECTVALFDGLSQQMVAPITRRYGKLVARWSVLTPDAWNAVLTRWLVRLIDQAVEAVPAFPKTQPYWAAVESACAQSTAALLSGDKAAADAAADAARAAAYAATNAAAFAARAAAYAATDAAANAARAAAYAATDAADYTAVIAARAAALDAAYAALFKSLLDEIEKEIDRAQSADRRSTDFNHG